MKTVLKCSAMLMLAAATSLAQAEVTVKEAWVRATVPQQHATGAFMQILSGTDMRLVEVQTSAAGVAEVHEMKMDNKVMKMRALPQLDLPAGKTVELKPGSVHLMLMDLKAQIKAGDTVSLILILEGKDKKRETVEVKAKARSLNSAEGKM